MEAPGHDSDDTASIVDGGGELTHSRRRLDPCTYPLECRDRHALKGRDPGTKARGEVDFAAHGRLRGRLHLRAAPGLVGEQLDHLVADQGGVGIEDDEEARSGHPSSLSITWRADAP
ncbi:hypothetical protein D3C73_1403440 [compost metagenome]